MSTEIYCSRFIDGEPKPFPANVLQEAFSSYIVSMEVNALLLRFGSSAEMPTRLQFCGPKHELSAFAVERPVEDLGLYQALLLVLQQKGSVAFSPGSRPVVAAAGSAEQLPEDMVSSLGVPVEVASPRALRDALFSQ